MTEGPLTDEALEEESLTEAEEVALVRKALTSDLGPEMAERLATLRKGQEEWVRQKYPDEGLRERKKRLTRQRISDIATSLFAARGFDTVTVAEIADRSGVSEKTVYNYFPTKESLVFDEADEQIERFAQVLRDRDPAESPTKALVAAFKQDLVRFHALTHEMPADMFPRFVELIATTPALRAYRSELQRRLVDVAREALAASAEVDPRDPEPTIAATALVGLQELVMDSVGRHYTDGLRGEELTDAVSAEVDRAARLLDTGLWSFNLLAQGSRTREQLKDAARAAEEARTQVVEALRQARAAWHELRRQQRHGHHH